MSNKTGITPTRAENFPDWYQSAVKAGDLADNSSVRGCMVIKPWGYGIWERIQGALDAAFKATGHENAYFPLFIPMRLIEKEAEHVEGFAKEMAVVTHHRLEQGADGLEPAAPLAEPLIVRPTSETIIGAVVRELDPELPRPAAARSTSGRTSCAGRCARACSCARTEFLWQEGHTAHATRGGGVGGDASRCSMSTPTSPRTYLAMPVVARREARARALPRRRSARSASKR